MRPDRSAVGAAKTNRDTANSVASTAGANAAQVGSSFIPGLERQAQNPTGFTPVQKNRMLVSGAEAIGGVNSGLRGDADLARSRTRSAGGFAPALDEAARIKSRQLSGNALDVENEDARLAQSNQRFAQSQLHGVYDTDRANQLRAMGLSDDAIRTQLEGGRQGWLQDTEGVINTLSKAGGAAFPKGFQG